MIIKFLEITSRYNRFALFPIYILICTVLFFSGCNFDSGGLGAGLNPQFGLYCLDAATRFVPTPEAIAGAPPTKPTLPISKEDCEKFAESLNMRWEFLRTDGPNSTPLVATHWDYMEVMAEEGIVYCVLNVVVSSDDILDEGLGTWQVKHQVENWSVTCPEDNINICPTQGGTLDVDTLVTNTTVGKEECEIGFVGIDTGPGPGFP